MKTETIHQVLVPPDQDQVHLPIVAYAQEDQKANRLFKMVRNRKTKLCATNMYLFCNIVL